jgi:hypothetical protein
VTIISSTTVKFKKLSLLWNVHIIRNNFMGRGGQRFVTMPCKNIGICTVLRYEGGGGSENPENRVS